MNKNIRYLWLVIAAVLGLFIGGKSVAPKSRQYFDSISPRDGKKLSEIPLITTYFLTFKNILLTKYLNVIN